LLPIIEAITFDAGDTLLHHWVHKTKRFAYLCRQVGIILEPDAARSAAIACERFFQDRHKGAYMDREWCLTHNMLGLQAAGVQGDLKQLAQDIYEVMSHLPLTWVLDSEAIATLGSLRQRGIRLGVISNWDGNLQQTLRDLHILSYFEMVLDSHIVGIRKPDPAIFALFAQAYSLDPAHCAHVGDSPGSDELLALSVGAIPVLYDPLECLPYKGYHVAKLSEILGLISR
jgi:putative hydrolase of the HAD superfamily